MRRLAFAAITLCCAVAPVLPSRVTHADETAAEKTARQIADARDDVAAASEAYQTASLKVEQLSSDQVALQGDVDALQGKVAELQAQVQQVAVNRFTRSSAEGSPILSGFSDPSDQMQLDAYSQVIWDASDNAFDEYDSLNREFTQKQRSLEQSKQRTQQQITDLAALRDSAAAKVEKLKKLEKQQLHDEKVQKALAAEEAKRAASAQASAQNSAKKVQASGSSSKGSVRIDNGSGGHVVLGGGASGDAVRFGNGIGYPYAPFGADGRATTTGIDWSGHDWVCPTGTATVGFGHSYHEPRPNGRVHQGIDMFAKRGTPVLAVVDGRAQAVVQDLGGMDVFLYANNGDFYFYAHFEAWGKLGAVHKGDIIGYVGMTGDAGTYHLHFEYHPGGVMNVADPYPLLAEYC